MRNAFVLAQPVWLGNTSYLNVCHDQYLPANGRGQRRFLLDRRDGSLVRTSESAARVRL